MSTYTSSDNIDTSDENTNKRNLTPDENENVDNRKKAKTDEITQEAVSTSNDINISSSQFTIIMQRIDNLEKRLNEKNIKIIKRKHISENEKEKLKQECIRRTQRYLDGRVEGIITRHSN